MEEIKSFILKFIDLDYKVRVGNVNISVPEESYSKSLDALMDLYSPAYQVMKRGNFVFRSDFVDKESLEFVVKREVFLLEKYAESKFGAGINPDDGISYNCYLNSGDTFDQVVYTRNFTITRVNGHLKIVSIRVLDNDMFEKNQIGWTYSKSSVEMQEGLIVRKGKEGTLVDVLKITPPEDEPWLTDYHQERKIESE